MSKLEHMWHKPVVHFLDFRWGLSSIAAIGSGYIVKVIFVL